MAEKVADKRTVNLKRIRLSFADGLVEKKVATEGARPRFSCNLLIESEQPEFAANKAAIIAALIEAGNQAFGEPKQKDDNGKLLQHYQAIATDAPKRVAFRKGERFKNDEGEVYKGYAGNWAISAAAGPGAGQKRCKLYDRHRRDVEQADIEDVCYTGSYADAIVSFYGGDEGGRGIFCSIDAIRSHQEGERLGGGGINVSADMFDELPANDSFDNDTSSGASSTPAPAATGDSDF